MNLDKILYTKRNLNILADDLNNFFDEFFKFYIDNKPKDIFLYKKEKLSFKLYPLLINGIPYEKAKEIIACELEIPVSSISKILDNYYLNYLYKIKPHKVYACHKLHDAGINNVTIAKLLNLSPATIRKYLLIPSKLE